MEVATGINADNGRNGHLVSVYIVAVAISLTTLGLVMLFSAGAVRGAEQLLIKQIIWLGLSLFVGIYAAIINLEWLQRRAWWIFGFSVLALMLTLLHGVGVKVNGAQRWIGLGSLRIQPSEFAKLGLILSLASYFAGNQRKVTTFWHGFLIPSVIIGMICGLIILQPDFGTCFLCGAVAATMMFQAGTSLKWLMPISGMAVTAFSILVYFDPVRIRRVTSFLDVEANAGDSAYQLWQGMLAFGVGGTNGVGLGLGRQQMHFLPEAHTDFIFPVIGEELGLIFTLGIVICFLFLFVLVYWRLRLSPRLFEYLLALGAILFVSLQAIINMGVVTGSMPTKGMSLPFISYGGSNLMVTFIFLGLIINVFRSWDNPHRLQPREI
ncbi:MAG: putative peptidoglycan glycosyltransferase FtsW [Verrucomicrobiota bacterium]|nr:putative peptidoglycan glycosyltransferase FtsW [Verrucomicrobiota bacterium]